MYHRLILMEQRCNRVHGQEDIFVKTKIRLDLSACMQKIRKSGAFGKTYEPNICFYEKNHFLSDCRMSVDSRFLLQ